MANPKRILYVSGEVEPFASVSEAGQLARTLPERVQDTGAYEARIMMPRYGTISERKNRLHEVIRLSGTDVNMGDATETLKVKVASIPGIRLQVYFMDNARFFKRKGLHADSKGVQFDDNTERAVFFGRSVFGTLKKLMWGPDVIHAFGWISGLLPVLLATEYADDELFAATKIVYTPCTVEAGAVLSAEQAKALNLGVNGEASGLSLTEIGAKFADADIEVCSFTDDEDAMVERATSLYDQVTGDVLV